MQNKTKKIKNSNFHSQDMACARNLNAWKLNIELMDVTIAKFCKSKWNENDQESESILIYK